MTTRMIGEATKRGKAERARKREEIRRVP